MKTLAFTLICVYLSIYSAAQTRSEGALTFKGNTYDVYMVQADSTALSRFSVIQNTSQLKHLDFATRQTVADSNILLINAGVGGVNCKPEGWLVAGGNEINALNLNNGNGNFYLKPNGALVLTAKQALIVESSKAVGLTGVVAAVQSGPMLLVNGNYNQQINAGSPNKNIRCGVGLFTKGKTTWLVFATSVSLVNFYDFATLFKEKYGCDNALCLESAGCAMYAPYIGRHNLTDDYVICNYIQFREQ